LLRSSILEWGLEVISKLKLLVQLNGAGIKLVLSIGVSHISIAGLARSLTERFVAKSVVQPRSTAVNRMSFVEAVVNAIKMYESAFPEPQSRSFDIQTHILLFQGVNIGWVVRIDPRVSFSLRITGVSSLQLIWKPNDAGHLLRLIQSLGAAFGAYYGAGHQLLLTYFQAEQVRALSLLPSMF